MLPLRTDGRVPYDTPPHLSVNPLGLYLASFYPLYVFEGSFLHPIKPEQFALIVPVIPDPRLPGFLCLRRALEELCEVSLEFKNLM